MSNSLIKIAKCAHTGRTVCESRETHRGKTRQPQEVGGRDQSYVAQRKGCLYSRSCKRQRSYLSWRLRGRLALLIPSFWTPSCRTGRQISTILSHLVCGTLLWQPRQLNMVTTFENMEKTWGFNKGNLLEEAAVWEIDSKYNVGSLFSKSPLCSPLEQFRCTTYLSCWHIVSSL